MQKITYTQLDNNKIKIRAIKHVEKNSLYMFHFYYWLGIHVKLIENKLLQFDLNRIFFLLLQGDPWRCLIDGSYSLLWRMRYFCGSWVFSIGINLKKGWSNFCQMEDLLLQNISIFKKTDLSRWTLRSLKNIATTQRKEAFSKPF